MDYDKLIEDLRWWAAYCGQPYGCLTARCILDNAVAAIETLCAENNRLREKVEDTRLEGYAKGLEEMSADLTHVTADRDAAIKDLNEFLSMDELCPIQCEWCKWNGTYCDGKTPEWRGPKKED